MNAQAVSKTIVYVLLAVVLSVIAIGTIGPMLRAQQTPALAQMKADIEALKNERANEQRLADELAQMRRTLEDKFPLASTIENDTALRPLIAYADLIRAKFLASEYKDFAKTARTFLDMTESREKAGFCTLLDTMNANVQLQTYEVEARKAQREVETAQDALRPFVADPAQLSIPELLPPEAEWRVHVDKAAGTVVIETSKMAASGKWEVIGSPRLVFRARPINKAALPKTSAGVMDLAVKRTVLNIETLADTIYMLGTKLDSAQLAYVAAAISFEKGLQSSFQVDDACDKLVQSETALGCACLDYAVESARLDSASGKQPEGLVFGDQTFKLPATR